MGSRSLLACCVRPQVEDEQVAVKAAGGSEHAKGSSTPTAVTAHAVAAFKAPAEPAAPMDASRQLDQAPSGPSGTLATQSLQPLPDLTPLMASNIHRPYTDDDWFAALRGLEKVQKVHQQRALAQLRAAHRIGGPAADEDADRWFDARSHTMSTSACITEEEREEVERLAHEMEEQDHAMSVLNVAIVREPEFTPTCVPNPPLLFAERHWKYCQVGDVRPFCAYWERDATRSSQFPLPIDIQMKLNSLFQKTHQSIPGMWIREDASANQLLLTASPTLLAIPGVVNYTEYFNKDSTLTTWTLRRDIHIGRTQGQMFMTTDGILIFRVFTIGMFSKKVEWVGEDYMRLEDNGETMIARQLCRWTDNSIEHQFLIGRKAGPNPAAARRSASGAH